jgi:hypothetical protein
MMKKLMLLAGVVVIAAASPAAAGGWAAATLDEPPAALVAGQDHQVGFMILQHGKTPVNPDQGQVGIRLFDPSSGQGLTFPAVQQGPVGHFVSTVNVPTAGAWQWEVLQGWFEPQPLGPIDVVAAASVAPAAPGSATAAATSSGASSGAGVDGWRIAAVVIAGLLLVAFFLELLLGRRKDRKPVPAPTQA